MVGEEECWWGIYWMSLLSVINPALLPFEQKTWQTQKHYNTQHTQASDGTGGVGRQRRQAVCVHIQNKGRSEVRDARLRALPETLLLPSTFGLELIFGC